MTVDEYWQKYLKESGKKATLKYNGEYQLGENSETIIQNTALVLAGRKTLNCSSVYSFDIDMIPLPKPHDYYVVTDVNDNPVCIVQNKNISVMAFKDVTWDIAQKEGEYSNIEQWRQAHIEFFEDEAALMGYEFSEDMPLLFEEFEVVYS